MPDRTAADWCCRAPVRWKQLTMTSGHRSVWRNPNQDASRRLDWLRCLCAPGSKSSRVLCRADGPQTDHEIIQRTLLADLTARYALNRLEEAELIRSRSLPSDPRQRVFHLCE